MKKYRFLYILIINIFSWCLHSQKVELALVEKKMKTDQFVLPAKSDTISESVRIIKSYKVVETINMKFGGYTLTYVVSDSNLIRTNNLGPGNTRVITPMFELKKKPLSHIKRIISDSIKPKSKTNNLYTNIKLDSIENIDQNSEKSTGTAYIKILKTYERIIEKGYKSIDMLKKVANGYYFENQLDKAAKFYKELFSITSDLEPEYYFRYAQSLKYINKNNKADEMMDQYNKKTKNNF